MGRGMNSTILASTTARLSLALLTGAVAALGLAACGDDPDTGSAELDQSVTAWEAFRDDADGNYTYTRVDRNDDETVATTVISVENGEVVSREYVPSTGTGGWVENGTDLGSHEEGFEPVLIDDLYDQCATDYVARDPADYDLELDFFANGLLHRCTSIPRNGIEILVIPLEIETIEGAPVPCGLAPDGTKLCG
jgi:hypothetical protein